MSLPIDKLLAYNFLTNSGIQETAEKTGQNSQKYFNSPGSITTGISAIIFSILSVVGIAFLVLMIGAGITWMTAQGDEEKVTKAKKIIRASVVGLIIVLAAYAISYFVINAFASQTLN
jgi:hypothetical protein